MFGFTDMRAQAADCTKKQNKYVSISCSMACRNAKSRDGSIELIKGLSGTYHEIVHSSLRRQKMTQLASAKTNAQEIAIKTVLPHLNFAAVALKHTLDDAISEAKVPISVPIRTMR
jgi:hypothetical protein